MKLVINGKECELLDVQTIADVVAHYGLTGKPLVVEAGGIVLTAEQWGSALVHPHMQIELVHFVGGG
ncbi:sulfur carrier protein [Paenibacillus taihuensis]|uniref:Sulfur carrier protein n=1 Tax=Paenibacillus taihuensis TaxID=1156355 RepID=A0A3D9QW49_9BACL|nr:sulfur carrier protein ThiS [Paenibacillus taihuensis]REE69627.1 sulfur carrier protein [Paenibacillus taihuensis]